jgi:hypothetical protein
LVATNRASGARSTFHSIELTKLTVEAVSLANIRLMTTNQTLAASLLTCRILEIVGLTRSTLSLTNTTGGATGRTINTRSLTNRILILAGSAIDTRQRSVDRNVSTSRTTSTLWLALTRVEITCQTEFAFSVLQSSGIATRRTSNTIERSCHVAVTTGTTTSTLKLGNRRVELADVT